MSESRVRVSLTDGTFEFEGPQDFVVAQVERFAGMIQAAVAAEWPPAPASATPPSEQAAPPVVADAPALIPAPSPDVEFSELFAPTDTGVQILKPVPGASAAQRTVNGAQLYLYGLRVLKQRDTAWFSEIKKVCKAHGCYDSHNMAAYLKSHQHAFVFGGNGKRQTVGLSAPGLHASEQLVAHLKQGTDAIAPAKPRFARKRYAKRQRRMATARRFRS